MPEQKPAVANLRLVAHNKESVWYPRSQTRYADLFKAWLSQLQEGESVTVTITKPKP
jgi:hypothetical protein